MGNTAEDREESMDDILKSIRAALLEKERKAYFQSFYPPKEPEEEIFVLSKNMLVDRADIPYQLGVWSFDDVAKKMMKKYKNYFNQRYAELLRVRVKEENQA